MILLSIASDPLVLKFVTIALAIVLVGFILQLIRQTDVIIYIITGIIIGPHVLKLVADVDLISQLGSMGLVLLLFFIGMEISLPGLLSNWKVSVVGTILQVIASVGLVMVLGFALDWSMARIVTVGFVISLSSTAVVLKYLQEHGELDSRVGQDVLGILIVQDILIVPMMVILGYLSGDKPPAKELILQITGGLLLIGFVIYLFRKGRGQVPFSQTGAGQP